MGKRSVKCTRKENDWSLLPSGVCPSTRQLVAAVPCGRTFAACGLAGPLSGTRVARVRLRSASSPHQHARLRSMCEQTQLINPG